MTYEELIAVVKDEAIDIEASFTEDHIALMVERAQLRIQRDMDLYAARVEQTVAAAGAEIYPSSDLITMRSVRLIGGDFLLRKEVSFLRDYWPDEAQTGTPKYYGWIDDTRMLVVPTPDQEQLELSYTVRIPALSESQPTNWLSLYAPDLLQTALVYEAALWSKDTEMIELYQMRYKSQRDAVALEQNLRRRNDEYRRGVPTVRTQTQ